jgi:hypothetical protein
MWLQSIFSWPEWKGIRTVNRASGLLIEVTGRFSPLGKLILLFGRDILDKLFKVLAYLFIIKWFRKVI